MSTANWISELNLGPHSARVHLSRALHLSDGKYFFLLKPSSPEQKGSTAADIASTVDQFGTQPRQCTRWNYPPRQLTVDPLRHSSGGTRFADSNLFLAAPGKPSRRWTHATVTPPIIPFGAGASVSVACHTPVVPSSFSPPCLVALITQPKC